MENTLQERPHPVLEFCHGLKSFPSYWNNALFDKMDFSANTHLVGGFR
jgi:hypothetical protein